MAITLQTISQQLSSFEQEQSKKQAEFEQELSKKKAELLAPAKERINEIRHQIATLQAEERQLNEVIASVSGKPVAAASGARRTRRASGKPRRNLADKKAILAKFVTHGHITDKGELTKSLRTALADEGLGSNDMRQLGLYLPAGWKAESNGHRGLLAKTVFHRV